MFVDVPFMRVMQMAVVQVIEMAFMPHGNMPTLLGVFVFVAIVLRVRIVHH